MGERLFVSIDLPERFRDDIQALQASLAPASGIRTVAPDQVHVTLAFIRDTPEDRVSDVRNAVAAGLSRADLEPFRVQYRGLGVFPSEEYISVVWLGVGEGSDGLTRLHDSLVGALRDAEVAVETHETFTPHATIARMDHGGGKGHVQDVLAESDPEIGTQRIQRVHLKRSMLGPDGPTYEDVETVELE